MSTLLDYSVLLSGASAQAVASAVVVRRLARSRSRLDVLSAEKTDLPSISILVPARNETHALEDHLTALLQSDYQKLEIIVLDDCSTDDTPSIIKAFAHDGVRFIEGGPVPDDWLGRNFACEQLRQEANGRYLVFMDVDTRVKPDSISRLIRRIESTRSPILGIMPRRSGTYFWSEFLSPLRHYFTLLDKYPATTALTVIEADWLASIDGFNDVKHVPVPESRFFEVAETASTGDFQVSSRKLGITSDKKWRSGVDRSLRAYSPELGLVRSGLYAIILSAHSLAPAALVATYSITGSIGSLVAGFVYYALLHVLPMYVYGRMAGLSGNVARSILSPVFMLQEVVLIVLSAIGYARGSISWKERNICLPRLRFSRSERPD